MAAPQRAQTAPPPNAGGFTLVEVLLAASIMAIALVMMFGSIISVSSLSQTTEDRTTAVMQMDAILEDVRRAVMAGDLREYQAPTIGGLGGTATWTLTYLDADRNEVLLAPDDSIDTSALPIPPNPTEVRVRITWTDQYGRPKTETATTFLRR